MSPYIDNDYYYFFKLCVLGKSSVGKSSLVFRFAGDEFHESCLPTMGVDFKIRKIQLNNKSIKLQLWDSAGQERFRSITQSYFKGSHGALFVFDLTDKQSFLDINMWHDKYLSSDSLNAKLILIGNKCDLVNERKVSYEEACEFARSLNMQYIETSAKTKENVEEAFFNLAKWIMEDADDRSNQSIKKIGPIQNYKQPEKSYCC